MNTPHTSQSLLLDHAESLQPLPSTTSVEEVERRAHVASVESIDFDFYESEQGLAVTATKRKRIVQAVAKWIAIAIIGVATGSVASGIDYGIVRLTEMRFGLMRTLVRHGLSSTLLVLANMAICTSLAGIAGALVCFVSPLAAGSGIPEVKCRLNGLDLPLVVKPQTLLAKACGVLFSVSAGLPCGKEGPMIHSGSIIGALLSKALQLYELLLFPDRDERDLIAAGGAAGVSSAFGAPVGGVLFALEEGASFWSPQVLLQALFCSSVSALTLNFFLGGFDSLGFGTLGALGVLTFGSYFQSDATSYRIWELPFFFGVGILGGLVGATFNALNVPLTIWRQWCVGAGGTRRFFEVMTVTAVISTAFVFLPAVMRQCVVPDVISDQHGDLKLICDASSESRQNSIESALGLFMTPSEDAIKVLFHDPAAFHPLYLVLFAALYFFMACWTYGLGVPSGLFVPSLLTGAALGRLLGEGLQAVCSRGQGGPGLHVSSPGVYALVGAAASLGGMARITISLAVILVEATGNTQFSMPIIFAVLTSKAVGDCFNRGIYDIHIHLKKLPFLEAPTEVECHKQLVSSVMTQDVRTVFPVESVARLKDLLGRNSHGAFPVVDSSSSFRFQGMLSRSALQSALQAQVGLESFQGRVLQGSNDGMHCDQMIELKSWISPAAFSISNTATVRRSFDLFRTMGLRHLPVVDSTGTLRGIVTRKDLAEHCTHD